MCLLSLGREDLRLAYRAALPVVSPGSAPSEEVQTALFAVGDNLAMTVPGSIVMQ